MSHSHDSMLTQDTILKHWWHLALIIFSEDWDLPLGVMWPNPWVTAEISMYNINGCLGYEKMRLILSRKELLSMMCENHQNWWTQYLVRSLQQSFVPIYLGAAGCEQSNRMLNVYRIKLLFLLALAPWLVEYK